MLALTPDRPAPEALRSCGGFAWWYVDAVDADGKGLVLIWSWGLPFLPGYTDAARSDTAPPAATRPSLNVALYDGGRAVFYLLQELRPDEAAHIPSHEGSPEETWRFGDTIIRSRTDGGRRSLEVALDVPIPGTTERLAGIVRIDGPVPDLPSLGAAPSFPHRWTPLCCPATATAELRAPGLDFRLQGRGYHDRNSSSVPLPALGIRDWAWGRVAVGDRELVHYLLWSEDVDTPPVQILFEVLPDGAVRHEAAARGDDLVTLDEPWRHPYGVRMHRRITLRRPEGPPIALTADPPVDSGPFYLRYALRDADGRVCGWGERVKPASVDLPWQRPFVRMRVHGPGSDSVWLPLFSGPRVGRVNRLLRGWGLG
jgi:hypothetical protein